MTRRLLLGPMLAIAVGASACSDATPARDQWLLEVRTDAPAPELFDRLLIEILDESGASACSSCRRQFGLSRESRSLSFGVAAVEGLGPLLLRVRLYPVRSTTPAGLPREETAIDRLVHLPDPQQVTPLFVSLTMRCFGRPSSLERGETCDPETGAMTAVAALPLGAPEPLSPWNLAGPIGCSEPASSDPDMACIPGGAFLMGDLRGFDSDPLLATEPERLVVLSPYAIDTQELTVATYRTLVEQTGPFAESPGTDAANYCSAGMSDPALPLNCVSRALARELCERQGKRLPTEAEWEFAAGNGLSETGFPWGDDDRDICNRAVLATDETVLGDGVFSECRLERPASDQYAGPRAGGDPNDVTERGVFNLAGNLGEWVADELAPYRADCWAYSSEPWLRNPHCDSGAGPFAIRGGSWRAPLPTARASARSGSLGGRSNAVGLRCARSLGAATHGQEPLP